MGKVIVQDYTYKKPITMIGVEAGICWGANTSNDEKNYLRGIDCLFFTVWHNQSCLCVLFCLFQRSRLCFTAALGNRFSKVGK